MADPLSSRSPGRPKNGLAPAGGGSGVLSEPGAQLSYRPYWHALGWLLVAAVVYFSLTPAPPQTGFTLGDKVGHLAAYASLMVWWGQLTGRPWRTALWLLLMGAAMEVAQGYTPDRQPSALDMLANALGVTLGWLGTRLLPRWLARLDRLLAA